MIRNVVIDRFSISSGVAAVGYDRRKAGRASVSVRNERSSVLQSSEENYQ